MEPGWIIFGLVVLIGGAIAAEAWLKRGRARRLSDTRPGPTRQPKPELGMEATDVSLVEEAHARNQAIERRNNQRLGTRSSVSAATRLAKRTGDKK